MTKKSALSAAGLQASRVARKERSVALAFDDQASSTFEMNVPLIGPRQRLSEAVTPQLILALYRMIDSQRGAFQISLSPPIASVY